MIRETGKFNCGGYKTVSEAVSPRQVQCGGDIRAIRADHQDLFRLISGDMVQMLLKKGANVCNDSRKVRPGDIFVAVRGVHVDGHDFVKQACQNGAVCIIAQDNIAIPDNNIALIRVENSAAALGFLAHAAAGNPGKLMQTLAVTGTNGKTTVAYLVRAILQSGDLGCGVVGTVEYDCGGGETVPADNTTPDAVKLAEIMARMVQNGLQAVVMECSSHGLDQDRLAGLHFNAAAFTNLTGDHLDYHGNRESYFRAKSRLFTDYLNENAIALINIQDPAGLRLASLSRGRVWSYGIDTEGEIVARLEDMDFTGSRFILRLGRQRYSVRTRLIGRHNIYNCLAAAGLARAVGVEGAVIAQAIESFGGVPGRLEPVDAGQDFTVLVDYAHTDDALENVMSAIRRLQKGKLTVIFGCGGDRDRSKRPRMAAVAEKWADRIVVTSDNSRTEDPGRILSDIRSGFSPAGLARVVEETDRFRAIEYALHTAQGGEVVLIAGKGHEDYQIIGGEKHHFDDRETARQILKDMR